MCIRDSHYTLHPTLNAVLQQVVTNKLGFTDHQVAMAYCARELYHMCGAPTVAKFKLLLKTGFLHNCPVAQDNVNNAEKIFGPDIPTLKGRTIRKTPPVTRESVVEIPDELLHQKKKLTLFYSLMQCLFKASLC